jgi:hypothetical protein
MDGSDEILRRASKLVWFPQKGPQEDLLKYKSVPEILFGGARGGGKGLKLSTEVLTTYGWSTVGDLKVGDVIFDADGKPTTVTFKSEPTLRQCYLLTFDNGQQIVADDVHRWITYSKAERVSNHKCTDEYRAKRRENRPSRAKSDPKNAGSQKKVTELNKAREYQYKEPNTGTMRDTQELFETLKVQNGREVNHAIKLAGTVDQPERDLPIPPYVLGVWLGDGSRDSGRITIGKEDSQELTKELFSCGYSVERATYDDITYKIERDRPFITELKELGVTDLKHIPEEYLHSSPQQRLELLQGLFDTDGSCMSDGQIEFCNTNEGLSRGVFELLASLGVKPFITSKKPICTNGKNGPVEGKLAWIVKATTALPVFRLFRKSQRLPKVLRETQKWHYITNIEPIDPVWTQCLTVDSPSHTFLVTRSFIPTHNTAALLGDFVSDVSVYKQHWVGMLFRRTYPELEEVIRQSFEFYPQTGASYNANEKVWKWPNGAKLYLRYMAHARDATNYQGFNLTWLGFDEVGNFATDEGFTQMIACLRSPHDVPHKRLRLTANPGGVGHGWVKARYGIAENPQGYKLLEQDTGLHRMFIPSRVTDNQILMKADPTYVQRLHEIGSPEMVRAWLHGDWDVVAGAYFPEFSQEHVIDAIDPDDIPNHWKIYRAYDHGTYHPFAVLWYTYAGEDWRGIKKGSIVILREWYGGNDKDEGLKMSLVDIRDGITERESTIKRRIEPGPADNQIFENHGGQSIADALAIAGVYFSRSDKSRIPGWNQIRMRLREKSLLFTRSCKHLLRTFPMLQHDDRRPEDVDTQGADHCFTGDTLVDMPVGQTPIALLPEQGYVMTHYGLAAYDKAGLKQKDVPVVEVSFADGRKVRCTPDHRFMTHGGWVEAKDLIKEDGTKIAVVDRKKGLILVTDVKDAGISDVYCLRVPSLHHFSILGGIIVHNCADVVRYIAMQWPVIPRFDKKKRRDPNAMTYSDLVEAVDDVSNRWRI